MQARVAQFRIEMRLLAETLRVPLGVVAWPARVVLFVYEIVLTSAVVQIGLALPMVVYFHRVGFSGLSANAFVVPLMGAVVPVGFLAVFTGWRWIARIAGLLMWLSQKWSGSTPPWNRTGGFRRRLCGSVSLLGRR